MRDPAFQRLALRVPGLRGLARRRARQLFDLLAGFTYTQTLLAFVRCRAPEALAGGPHPLGTLAPRLDLPEDAARQLLDAAVALELAAGDAERGYALGPLGLPLLGRPEIGALLEHDTLLYDDLRVPDALLRDARATPTALSRCWAYARSDDPRGINPAVAAAYSEVMAATQPLVAQEALDAYDFGARRAVLDVGGGDGRFLRALAERHAGPALHLFELPAVAARARAAFAAAGLAARATVHEGSFHDDPLPPVADTITLVRVCFDHDDARVLALLRRAHAALPAGGEVVIVEPMAGLSPDERVGRVYFAWYLRAMRSGRPRTPDALVALLRSAGFAAAGRRRTLDPLQAGVVVGRR